MRTLAGRALFTLGADAYTWEDVVLAGCMWGDWTALEARAREGLACLARLDDLDDAAAALDEADVDAAAEEFRYARDLIAAADLEAWLNARGLSVDDWMDYLRGALLRRRWADELADLREEYELDEDEVAHAVLSEAICSGVAAELGARLAARAAMHARALETGAAPEPAPLAPDVDARVARALPGLTPAERGQRLSVLARLEAAWQRFTDEAAPASALRALVAARGLDWMRLTTVAVLAPDPDVARELTLCVREDGRRLEDVAADAGLTARTGETWLEDVPAELRDALVAAQAGDLIGPVETSDGHAVLTVVAKRLPAEDDPGVRARAERALLARTVERETTNRVRWHETL
jgi:hypothetical protein